MERGEGEREGKVVGGLEIIQYKESPKPTPSRQLSQLSAINPIATLDETEIGPTVEEDKEVETRSLDDDKEEGSVESDDLDEPSQ